MYKTSADLQIITWFQRRNLYTLAWFASFHSFVEKKFIKHHQTCKLLFSNKKQQKWPHHILYSCIKLWSIIWWISLRIIAEHK